MQKTTYKFSGSATDVFFSGRFSQLKKITDPRTTILVTDEHIYKAHGKLFSGWNTIVLQPGEENKVQATADEIIDNLIEAEADRSTTLVGVGGGMITDLVGYVASIFMRGIRFGFVPSSLLGLVDASIGGKNGIDVGEYKNMVGVIRQPAFILQDTRLLKTLPGEEWENGFAEIIKHACIKDAVLFTTLEKHSLEYFQRQPKAVTELVKRNAQLKIRVVQKDEFEKADRKLLNFGHTLGHALETQYELSHGQAIAVGMTYACHISEQLAGFRQTERVVGLLRKYHLPTYASFEKQTVFDVLKMDKKRVRKNMNYVLLTKIGRAIVKPIPLKQLEKIIQNL